MFILDGYNHRGLHRGSPNCSKSAIHEWPKNGQSETFQLEFSGVVAKKSNTCFSFCWDVRLSSVEIQWKCFSLFALTKHKCFPRPVECEKQRARCWESLHVGCRRAHRQGPQGMRQCLYRYAYMYKIFRYWHVHICECRRACTTHLHQGVDLNSVLTNSLKKKLPRPYHRCSYFCTPWRTPPGHYAFCPLSLLAQDLRRRHLLP